MQAHLGTMSLYNSILILPAGVLPMETSKKTMGRAEVVVAVLDMLGGCWSAIKGARLEAEYERESGTRRRDER